MSFSRYPKYKDSGVEWLGEVPGHWKAIPIKHLGRLKGGAGFPHENQGIDNEELSFHKVNALAQADSGGFLAKSDNTIDRATAKELGAFIFPPDSIVFAKVGAALLLGRIRMLNQDACLDNNMMGMVIRENEFHVKFVRHAMNLVRFDLIANPGAVPSLNEGQIGDFRLPMPPLPEQTAIATFLDRETAKMDALVAEQEKLIAILKEKRQAVISHAVTKGLDPTVPMKDSGVEWLGEVPERWAVASLKRGFDVRLGKMLQNKSSNNQDEIVPYLRAANIQWSGVDVSDVKTMWLSPDERRQLKLRFGDLLVSEGGDVGRSALWRNELDDCYIQNSLNRIRDRDGNLTGFLYYWMATIKANGYIDVICNKSTIAHFTAEKVSEVPTPFPTTEEQTSIATFLDRETAKMDSLTAEAEGGIVLLKERRSALISAAVTGKIDVREIFHG